MICSPSPATLSTCVINIWYMYSTRHRGLTVYSVPCLVLATIASVTDQLKTCHSACSCISSCLEHVVRSCLGCFKPKSRVAATKRSGAWFSFRPLNLNTMILFPLEMFSAYKPVLNSVIQYVSQSKQRVSSYTNIVRPPRAHSLSAPSAQPLRPERADTPPRACSRSAPSAQPL